MWPENTSNVINVDVTLIQLLFQEMSRFTTMLVEF